MLDDLMCIGNETDLTSCGNAFQSQPNCRHNEDVGVECEGEDIRCVSGLYCKGELDIRYFSGLSYKSELDNRYFSALSCEVELDTRYFSDLFV